MKHKLINFDSNINNLIVRRGKPLCWILFLIKLWACNFPVDVAKFLRTAFFIKNLFIKKLFSFIHTFPRKKSVAEV